MKTVCDFTVFLILVVFINGIQLASASDQKTLTSSNVKANSQIENTSPVIVGIFPRRNPAVTIKLFTPLIEYLSTKFNRSFKLETATDFKTFLQRLKQRRYDIVHFNQYHYILNKEKLGYDVLVQNEEFGEATIKGAIYVRHDSKINTITDLKGKTILFGGGKSAMMSYIVPTYLLHLGGLKTGDYHEKYAVSPPNAVLAIYLHHADAAGAGEVVRRLPMIRKKIDTSQLKLLAVSDELTHLPWAVKLELKDSFKMQLKQILIDMKNNKLGREVLMKAKLTALNPVFDKDYDAHRSIVNALKDTQ